MAVYTVSFNAVAVTAAQDLFELNAPADAVCMIHAVELSQNTEIGDAQEEMLNIIFKRATNLTTSGTGGTSATAVPTESGAVAFGGTAEVNNTTKIATGTGAITTIRPDAWNVRSPYLWLPTPEQRFVIPPSWRLGVELVGAPTDSITMNGCLWFEEIG